MHLQPTNPRQSCTLINGSGTISDADITDIEVTCETLPDGGVLDTAFGTDGGMQIDFFGAADTSNAVAIQLDGSILIGGTATNGTVTGLGLVRIYAVGSGPFGLT